jgi:hypothetical protein
MSNNYRAFIPFDLRKKKKNVFSLMKGESPVKIFSLKSNYALFDHLLNKKQAKIKRDASKAQIFMELFYLAIYELMKLKFRM